MLHTKMARCLCAILLIISFHLFGVSNCSRPFSPEEHRLRGPTGNPAAQHDEAGTRTITEDDGQSRSTTRADDGGAAAPASMAMASPRDDKDNHGGVVVSSGHRNALVRLPAPVLRRSKLARRFLVAGEVEGADTAARASCRSSDVHISCTPPPEH